MIYSLSLLAFSFRFKAAFRVRNGDFDKSKGLAIGIPGIDSPVHKFE